MESVDSVLKKRLICSQIGLIWFLSLNDCVFLTVNKQFQTILFYFLLYFTVKMYQEYTVEEYGNRLVMFQMIRKMESDIEDTGKNNELIFDVNTPRNIWNK